MIDFRNKDVIVVELKKTVSSKSVNSVLQRKLHLYYEKSTFSKYFSGVAGYEKRKTQREGLKRNWKNKFAVREQLADPT